MLDYLVRYLYSIAALMLTLDFTFHLSLILPILILPTIRLLKRVDKLEDGYLKIARAVCRIE